MWKKKKKPIQVYLVDYKDIEKNIQSEKKKKELWLNLFQYTPQLQPPQKKTVTLPTHYKMKVFMTTCMLHGTKFTDLLELGHQQM